MQKTFNEFYVNELLNIYMKDWSSQPIQTTMNIQQIEIVINKISKQLMSGLNVISKLYLEYGL